MSNLPILFQDKENSPALLAYLQQFGEKSYLSAEEINQIRDAINELAQGSLPDAVLKTGTISITGLAVNIAANAFAWRINQQSFLNPPSYGVNLTAAANGFYRADIIVGTSTGTYQVVQGNPSATTAIEPNTPEGTIRLAGVVVFGMVVGQPTPTPITNFIEKSERANVVLTGSGTINQLDLVDEKATIVFKDAITRLNTISYASVPYNGKRITLFNAQATPVTIGHSVSGYGVDFVFPDGQDYILLPNETIEFSFDITYAPYAHHMLIGAKGVTIWAELEDKPTEFPPSAHTHIVSEITDFPTFKTIENQSIIGIGNIDLDKNSVGLGNVDNTSDLNKIISTATQTALNEKANISGQVFTGAVSATNLSGTNTGDNAPNSLYSGLVTNATHTGEVTGSTALTITNGAVTNAKLANVATSTLKGRVAVGTGVVADLTASQVRTLLNVADGANNYVHPANHPASIITQDASNRFVTDTEKSAWNAKEPAIASGTISQYWRGDKTWQSFPAQATVDQTIIDGSTNAVAGNAVFDALATKAPISSVHNPVTLGTANGLSLATQQLSLGLASSGTTGALSGTDWNNFNSKFNTPTGLTTNYLPKWNGSGFGNSQIFDNGTNVGIGSTSIQLFGFGNFGGGVTSDLKLAVGNATYSNGFAEITNGSKLVFGYNNAFGSPNEMASIQMFAESISNNNESSSLRFFTKTGTNSVIANEKMRITPSGRVLINKTDDDLTNQLQVNGTISASPATLPNQVPTWGQVQAAAKPYKVYTALLSQTGTNAPTATVLENTLGGTVVWTRSNVGTYTATLNGAFILNKTCGFFNSNNGGNPYVSYVNIFSINSVSIQTVNSTNGISFEAGFTNASVEIRVYL